MARDASISEIKKKAISQATHIDDLEQSLRDVSAPPACLHHLL